MKYIVLLLTVFFLSLDIQAQTQQELNFRAASAVQLATKKLDSVYMSIYDNIGMNERLLMNKAKEAFTKYYETEIRFAGYHNKGGSMEQYTKDKRALELIEQRLSLLQKYPITER